MTMGLPCDSDGYDLRIEQCRICGSRGRTKKHSCRAMTTPRDDIDWLIERLQKRSAPSEYSTGDVLGEEAATQLDALSARVKELEERVYSPDTITFHECGKGHGWLSATNWIDSGCPWCQRDEAYERAVEVALEYDKGNLPLTGIYNAGKVIAAAIRRLASGPEKEKKE